MYKNYESNKESVKSWRRNEIIKNKNNEQHNLKTDNSAVKTTKYNI